MTETTYQQVKQRILALAKSYNEGDEQAKAALRKSAEFFPVSRNAPDGSRSMFIRIRGEIFLVEDTPGGEEDVFALLLPLM